jgi:decaprenylphospho-beta-D-erythro-pentofuranosid-2-ulose 2-reductase
MNRLKYTVVVGATSLIAQHCVRIWLKESPLKLVLIGRSESKLVALQNDLKVRSPESEISCRTTDFMDPVAINALIDELSFEVPVDTALIAHGSLPNQKNCEDKLEALAEALNVNGISPTLFAQAFVEKMVAAGAGQIVVIGSVAGDRGRKSNYAYGAAKGLVTRFTQGLQHRLADTKVKVILVKPGPTDTPMTESMDKAKLAPVELVAQAIVDGVKQGKPVIYAPGKWLVIMQIIRHLPVFIFNKLNI